MLRRWIRQRRTWLYFIFFGNLFIFFVVWSRRTDIVRKNYFLTSTHLHNLGFLVNTPECKIYNFSTQEDDIKHLIIDSPAEILCDKTGKGWSYIDNSELVFDVQRISQDGYDFESIKCSYYSISRNLNSDNPDFYMEKTDITKERTRINDSAIVVECYNVINLHREYHFVPAIKGKVSSKINFWQQKKKSEIPPNVIIIGIDSTSRLNFRRGMPRTAKTLEKLNFIEYLAYIKVGENTYPNLVPLLSGYSAKDLISTCMEVDSDTEYYDDCPMVWKRYSESMYLTMIIEDAPQFSAFNYMKRGFFHQPTDFYPRPNFMAACDMGHPELFYLLRAENVECIGSRTNDEIILDYIRTALEFSKNHSTPLFSVSWSTTMSHDNFNTIKIVDELYNDFFENNFDEFQNSIIIFMSDHGYRFGEIRETLVGFYEDKLPNLWIYVGDQAKSKLSPEWMNNLIRNRGEPVSNYNVHETLLDILKLNSNNPDQLPQEKLYPRPIVNSLFQNNVNSSCAKALIPDEYCPCTPVDPLKNNDAMLLRCAEESVKYLNTITSSDCEQLKLQTVTAGAMHSKPNGLTRVVINFSTDPGDFTFEAELDYGIKDGQETFSNFNLLRSNRINKRHVKCVKNAVMELYCYCK